MVSSSLMGAKTKYCDTVFFLWEHSIRSKDAVLLNKLNIRTTLREQLVSVKRMENFRQSLYFRRFYINLGVVAVVVAISTGIWFMLNDATLATTSENVREILSQNCKMDSLS
jgi:hypothetical protein